MNTLPLDLLNLIYEFSSSLEYYYFGKDPTRCNNVREALITNNWQYINFCIKPCHKSDIFEFMDNPDKSLENHKTLKGKLKAIRKVRSFINKITIQPNIGPPHSIWAIDDDTLKYDQKEYDIRLRSSLDGTCLEPIVLKLVEHTPFQDLTTNKYDEHITHRPQVGSVCSTTSSYTRLNYVVVSIRNHIEVSVARITHIDKTTVTYDNYTVKPVAKFISSRNRWKLFSTPTDKYGQEVIFDQYRFNRPQTEWL